MRSNNKIGKKTKIGKNIKIIKECDDTHEILISKEPECFICLQNEEGIIPRLHLFSFQTPILKRDL